MADRTNINPGDLFDDLMAVQNFAELTAEKKLACIARLVDASGDRGREDGLVRALDWCNEIEKQSLSPQQESQLEYCCANAWGHRYRLKQQDSDTEWNWEQPELQQEILHLRRAIAHPGFGSLNGLVRCQILTNLGSQLSKLGRGFEAIEVWDRAIEIDPRFAMALGNRGKALATISDALYDPGHEVLYLWFVHKDLSAALSPKALWDHPASLKYAGPLLKRLKTAIEATGMHRESARSFNLNKHSLGRSKQEKGYRSWCLRNRLFLNPLNDLGRFAIAGRDILSLPSITTATPEPPTIIGFFSQLKQEFVSARWLFFAGMQRSEFHFSDRGVLLYDTQDQPKFCLAIEQTKAAYKAAYSLFDKIAFFLNEYLQLGVHHRDVYFQSIWFSNRRNRVLRPEFHAEDNWPLRGLYWLSKDLFVPDFQEVMEPDARDLYEIRNRIEHSYFKVLQHTVATEGSLKSNESLVDTLAYSISRKDFDAKTMRLLKLARAAFLYLALAIHRAESKRESERTNEDLIAREYTLLNDTRRR